MPGILQVLAAAGEGPVDDFGGSMTATRVPSSTAATASVTFGSTGSVSGSIGGTGSNGASGDNWYLPNKTGVGSGYWVRASLTSGQGPNTGTTGSWLSLSGGQTWSYSSGGGAIGSRDGTLLFEIASEADGTPVVASGSFSFSVYNEL